MDADLETMGRVLLFLYTGNYDDETAPILGKPIQLKLDEGSLENAIGFGLKDVVKAEYHTPAAPSSTASDLMTPTSTIATQSKQTTKLLANAQVYFCAKKFDIGPLAMLAKQKFISSSHDRFSAIDFVEPAQIVFENTATDDMGLRSDVIRICIANLDRVEANQDLTRLLQTHERTSWTLLQEIQTRFLATLDKSDNIYRKTVKDFYAKSDEWSRLSEINIDLANKEKKLKKLISRISSLLHKTEGCRNCGADFSVSLEVIGGYDGHDDFLLRCANMKCRCKHRDNPGELKPAEWSSEGWN